MIRMVWPPFRDPRFWVAQGALLCIVVLHHGVFGWMVPTDAPPAVPPSLTSALLLIPVIYAALAFGVRGAVATAVWATVLNVPHLLWGMSLTPTHVPVEAVNTLVYIAVAVVVGMRVDRERSSRERAEGALHAEVLATVRYQALFDEHPAAVVIADADGVITEANSAATRLFADARPGVDVAEVVGAGVGGLLEGVALGATTRDGEERLVVPSARVVSADVGAGFVQIVFVDITEQNRSHEEQRLFGARLLSAQEDERRRLARDLHDDPLQTLMFLSRGLDDLSGDPRLPPDLAAQARVDAGLATNTAGTLRKVIRGLRPPVLDDLGLTAALRQLVDEARERAYAPVVELHVSGAFPRLQPEMELAAYRVVQESLTNVARHAEARCVRVSIDFAEALEVRIDDDGRGIGRALRSPSGHGASAGSPGTEQARGLGLVGMRERVSAVGGYLSIRRRSPRGTSVRAVLPLTSRSGDDCVPLILRRPRTVTMRSQMLNGDRESWSDREGPNPHETPRNVRERTQGRSQLGV